MQSKVMTFIVIFFKLSDMLFNINDLRWCIKVHCVLKYQTRDIKNIHFDL